LIYTAKTLVITATLALVIGGLVVAFSKVAIDMSLSQIKTATTQSWAPHYGNLTLSARVIAENEVMLNVTFSGTAYVNQPGYVWVLSVSNSIIPGYRDLPEGLELEEGATSINKTCPVPDRFLSLQATLWAIADGEWVVYGKLNASSGPGFFVGMSTEGIEITVSNGKIVRLEKAPHPSSSPPSSSGGQSEHPTSP
jgi:hypothetical protein